MRLDEMKFSRKMETNNKVNFLWTTQRRLVEREKVGWVLIPMFRSGGWLGLKGALQIAQREKANKNLIEKKAGG